MLPSGGGNSSQGTDLLQVSRFSKVADSRTEMRVQRLQWYRDVARHPNSNRLLTTAWYGRFGFEAFEKADHSYIIVIQNDIKVFWIHIPGRNRMCCRRLVTTATFSRSSGLVLLQPPLPLATLLFFGRPFSCMPFHPLELLISCTWHRLWSRSIMFMFVGF